MSTTTQPMFCYQCEQAANNSGCITQGICGKNPDIANLQDLLLYTLQGLAYLINVAKKHNVELDNYETLIYEGLFTTVTNVAFAEDKIISLIQTICNTRDSIKNLMLTHKILPQNLPYAVTFFLPKTSLEMQQLGKTYNIMHQKDVNPDIRSLQHTLLFGIKGIAAYANHALILGHTDPTIYDFLIKSLASFLSNGLHLDAHLTLLMECGTINLRTMEILDQAHTAHYGKPSPTAVPLGAKQGKAILVSGHDLHDLELLLKQTANKNIFIYTHGEMLPAHGYPQLKKYPHFYGHYGTAWQNQHQEFASFPGAILVTTNCIQKPQSSYQDRIFTTGLVSWPGVPHIDNQKDFALVINKALQLPGFSLDTNQDSVMVGFSHHAVLGVADKIIDLVKNKQIRHFFLVAGCDGAKPGRNYYTEFVEKAPKDCIILTLACGKFRFFNKKLGEIGTLPRLLDIGQCNDAYSAIKIATALAQAFNCGVNDLPLSLILSWYEQKAVAILLTLLSLGIKNIRLGPSLPAFITPNVLKILVENFNIKPITTPHNDLAAILGKDSVS